MADYKGYAQNSDILDRLIRAREKFAGIRKDETVKTGQFSYNFMTWANLLSVVGPALLEEGLYFYQDPTYNPDTKCVEVLAGVYSGKEELMFGPMIIPLANPTPQAVGSAISYAKRYQLSAILGIAAEDDDDGHTAEQQFSKPMTPRPTNMPEDVPESDVPTDILEMAAGLMDLVDDWPEEVIAYAGHMRAADESSQGTMPTDIKAGKRMSMYGFLCAQIDKIMGGNPDHKIILSAMLNRPVSKESPPGYKTKFILDDMMSKDEDTVDYVSSIIRTVGLTWLQETQDMKIEEDVEFDSSKTGRDTDRFGRKR